MRNLEEQLNNVGELVEYIDILGKNIIARLNAGLMPEEDSLKVMAESMEAVSKIVNTGIKSDEWKEIYSIMQQNIVPADFVNMLVMWETDVCEWCEKVENIVKNEKGTKKENDKIFEELVSTIKTLTKEVNYQRKLIEQLYQNWGVRKGWYREINKEKIDYMLEMGVSRGVTKEKREKQIIVSLTSYPDRMYDIKYTIYSLLNQTLKPDKVVLWLAKEQFPNLEEDIAESLLKMKDIGLTIMWCKDIKSYKKLIPALKAFPDDIIVTADDDIYYQENWLELLYNSYLVEPEYIHCHRAHEVQVVDNGFGMYKNWKKEISCEEVSHLIFPTGCGGVLYPPRVLHEDVCKEEYFMTLAPKADDIWFWTMGVLNRTKVRIVKNGVSHVKCINPAREIGMYDETTLAMENTGEQAGNDKCFKTMLKAYPELLDILSEE